MENVVDTILQQRLHYLAISVVIFACIYLFASRWGYFRTSFPFFKGMPRVDFREILTAFTIFFTIQLLIVPTVAWVILSLRAGQMLTQLEAIKVDPITQGWLNLIAVIASFLGLALYLLLQPSQTRNWIVWGGAAASKIRAAKDFTLGALSWFIGYPLVAVNSQIINLIGYFVGPRAPIDQVAVKNLKMTIDDPFLFYFTAFVIIVIVPITEEILFRGFLQRWLVASVGRFFGIILAAFIFALFHFSPLQQWENIELISSLFILALFLGYIYERQGSLWAPIGLHIFFNATSVLFITLGELKK